MKETKTQTVLRLISSIWFILALSIAFSFQNISMFQIISVYILGEGIIFFLDWMLDKKNSINELKRKLIKIPFVSIDASEKDQKNDRLILNRLFKKEVK